MSKAKSSSEQPQQGIEPEAPESTADKGVSADPAAEAETQADVPAPEVSAEEQIARLEAETAALKDQLLRALAETENVRRRAERERGDAIKYAAAPMLKDLLAVADNLSRPIESIPEGTGAEDQRVETLLAGVKLTERELNAVFERHHVVKLDPIGERLDPHRHEAMFEIPDPSRPAGTVAQVMQCGYLLHDRLLRPARVGVAKGGPPAKAEAGPASESPEQPAEAQPDAEAAPGSHVDTEA